MLCNQPVLADGRMSGSLNILSSAEFSLFIGRASPDALPGFTHKLFTDTEFRQLATILRCVIFQNSNFRTQSENRQIIAFTHQNPDVLLSEDSGTDFNIFKPPFNSSFVSDDRRDKLRFFLFHGECFSFGKIEKETCFDELALDKKHYLIHKKAKIYHQI